MKSTFLLLLCAFFSGGSALYENCDYYQELQPNTPYYIYNREYPNKYAAGTSCRWTAVSPPGTKIFLVCESFTVPPSTNCYLDRLTISLTGKTDFSDGENYCGNGSFNVISDDNRMALSLIANRRSPGGSFLCNIGIEESTPPPPKCECGWRNMKRIVNGQETGVNEFPMMAGLIDGLIRSQICGATIISERYSVTAAHCLVNRKANEVALLVGDHDLSTGSDTDSARLYIIDLMRYHPEYNTATQVNDIALVRTAEKIIFNKNVGPVCLPFLHTRNSFEGDYTTALGWGSTDFGSKPSDKLMGVGLGVISNDECKKAYGNRITNKQLCTYEDDKDSCQSDSGGPLLWTDPKNGRVKLVGVISYGVHCASGYPGVNTRVTEYLDWIKQQTGEDYCVA